MVSRWFSKSKKVAKGVRLNISKGGPSLTLGGKQRKSPIGTSVNLSKRGMRTTFSFFGLRIRL